MWQHSSVTCVGLIVYGAGAVFGMDACHLFPQHVLVVLLLIGSVQVLPGLGVLCSGRLLRCAPGHTVGGEAAHNYS